MDARRHTATLGSSGEVDGRPTLVPETDCYNHEVEATTSDLPGEYAATFAAHPSSLALFRQYPYVRLTSLLRCARTDIAERRAGARRSSGSAVTARVWPPRRSPA